MGVTHDLLRRPARAPPTAHALEPDPTARARGGRGRETGRRLV